MRGTHVISQRAALWSPLGPVPYWGPRVGAAINLGVQHGRARTGLVRNACALGPNLTSMATTLLAHEASTWDADEQSPGTGTLVTWLTISSRIRPFGEIHMERTFPHPVPIMESSIPLSFLVFLITNLTTSFLWRPWSPNQIVNYCLLINVGPYFRAFHSCQRDVILNVLYPGRIFQVYPYQLPEYCF